MPEQRVYCGGLAPARRRASDLLIDVNAPAGHPSRINLRLDQLRRRLADNIPEELIDLIEIAAYIYCADQFTSRGSTMMRAMGAQWRRHFHVKVPVRQFGIWTKPSVYGALTQTLSFLT